MRSALLILAFVSQSAASASGNRASVLAVDELQRAAVAKSDIATLERLSHPYLRINAPGGRVLTREQFLANMRSGEIAAEAFTRTAEDVTISGDVAVVMGREKFTPKPDSGLGRTFGARPLERRYTNVYLRKGNHWFWRARHANVVSSR